MTPLSTPRARRAPALAALLAALALVLTACGAERTDPVTPTAGTAYPLTVQADNGDATVPARPSRIVSLSPTGTEMLFAIGAGSQVIAVDSYSTYPPDAPITDLSAFTPNLEAVLAHEPDLVVASDDANGLVDGLRTAQVPTLLLGAADQLEDTYAQLNTLGTATDHTAGAQAVVSGMQQKVTDIVASVPQQTTPLSYYYELEPTLYTVTSASFVGTLLARLGLTNIADSAGSPGNAYPQLSAEALAKADPDLVFLADTKCCNANAQTYAARPGLGGSTAVATGSIVALDDDLASRWGPRTVDLLAAAADAVRSRSAG
ncbi:ABC transporter substrate-binding protein [Rhodococcus sp. X156]|uniref:ABC transporter substrate-binding protein n=1 Tax=Rhodococcus sp. X156 TaxID=2499145 RepID=UPI000FD6C366|nr:ABC transporter substrate-binding protein [Rhodococcus sp. X156]